jgi:glycine/D-amino acid oxidase-like deaminating enzyme
VASGHGFKHGPVIGEMVADAVLGTKMPNRLRFADNTPDTDTRIIARKLLAAI